MKHDIIVLGAGMVGVCTALHLQKLGFAVALVDRREPGAETSFGNAGLIQAEGVYPYAFPRAWRRLLRYAGNRAPDLRFHWRALPVLAPVLWQYWTYSAPARHARIAQHYAPLILRSVAEHQALAQDAGALPMLRPGGWIKAFRDAASLDAQMREVQVWRREFGVEAQSLDREALRALEPDLGPALIGGVRFGGALSVGDPQALVQAYAACFESLGGRVLRGDAATLRPGWSVDTQAGEVRADRIVLALGPWTGTALKRLGVRVPLWVKRGYHMHYAATDAARLRHPVLDADVGYVLAPMRRGVRLTTGAELGLLDRPATPYQLPQVEARARDIFALGPRLDAQPWLGQRPCTPDMMPLIGPVPAQPGLWVNAGHAHHGFTLGPVSGRLLAQMISGEPVLADPAPYAPTRF